MLPGSKLAVRRSRMTIVGCVAAALLGLAALGASTVARVAAIRSAAALVAGNDVPRLLSADRMQSSFATFSTLAQHEIIERDDPGARKAAQDREADLVRAYQDAETAYQNLMQPGPATDLFAAVTATSGAYLASYGRLRHLLDAGHGTDIMALYARDLQPATDKFDAALTGMVAFNRAELQRDGEGVLARLKMGQWYVAGCFAAAAVVGGLAGSAWATDQRRRRFEDAIAGFERATGDAVAAIRGIGTKIEQISAIATDIAAAAEQRGDPSGAAAAKVLGAATELAKQAERLSADVDRFVADMRAA
jgi:hypothetical protein